MEKIKVTIEIPVERLGALQDFLTVTKSKTIKKEPVPVPEEPAVVAEPAPSVESPKKDDTADNSVTKSMIRARGVEITKADKQDELRKIFDKFGAKNLSTLKEEDYAEAYKMMMEVEV